MRPKYSIAIWRRIDMGHFINLNIKRTKFRFKLIALFYYYYAKLLKLEAYISYIPKYSIDTDIGVSYQDIGPWRSYQLETAGDTIEELIANASISEIDQDGGDLNTYELADAPNQVEIECLKLIHREVSK